MALGGEFEIHDVSLLLVETGVTIPRGRHFHRVFVMIISNLENIPGRTIKTHLGIVHGSTVRAKHFGRDLLSGLKNIVGGELVAYTELMQESRQLATDRMVDEAEAIGANAVLNIRYTTATIAAGAAEILAYGSAVILE